MDGRNEGIESIDPDRWRGGEDNDSDRPCWGDVIGLSPNRGGGEGNTIGTEADGLC